jgi:cell division septation protein DedD
VYTPPPDTPAYRAPDEDGGGSRQWLVLTIMVIVLITGGYVLWTAYGGDAPRAEGAARTIEAENERFKEPYDGPPMDELATAEIDQALEGRAPKAVPKDDPEPIADIAVAVREPPPAKAQPTAALKAAPGGGFVVQIAALRSEGAADAAWDRLARRDAALFAGASKDIQRADLGPKGVYHRLRAGYFADRAEAARFCDRVKTLGQECIVVVR